VALTAHSWDLHCQTGCWRMSECTGSWMTSREGKRMKLNTGDPPPRQSPSQDSAEVSGQSPHTHPHICLEIWGHWALACSHLLQASCTPKWPGGGEMVADQPPVCPAVGPGMKVSVALDLTPPTTHCEAE
jgi:hypothetical protein